MQKFWEGQNDILRKVLNNKKNLLLLLIFFLTSGFLSFNLWFFFAKPAPLSPIPGELASKNLPQKSFGEILSQTPTPKPQIAGVQITGKVTIALLGDSMIDTMGDLKNLQIALSQYYPKIEFNLLNYGVGSTKPADGLARLTQEVTTETKKLPALLLAKPDIVILESFAYNHGTNTQSEINNHYQILGQIITKLQQSKITPLFLVTIAPATNFAKNAPGVLWDENQRTLETKTVLSYLKAGLDFFKTQKLILVDSFTPSLEPTGFGKQVYVNSNDNIHPSQEGIELISDLIAQKIAESKLVEKVLD